MAGPVLIRNIFRHPYPLPAPPSLPRDDEVIVTAHSPREKNINTKWVEPDAELSALIDAAGEEHNLVRRSNACGALKVLASKGSNRCKLCRTTGLLNVLVRACWDDAVDSDALDARTRAVIVILYLSEPKDNRLIVAGHPRLLEALVKAIREDTGEARWRAASALATLSKTPGNRGRMGRADGLATALGDLMVVDQDLFKPRRLFADGEDAGESGMAEKKGVEDDMISPGGTKSFDTADEDEDERTPKLAHTGTMSVSFSEELVYHCYEDESEEEEEGQEDYDEEEEEEKDDHDHGDFEYLCQPDAPVQPSPTSLAKQADEKDNDEDDENDDGSIAENSYGDDEDDSSIPSESGVEMQISSLKMLNIENASDFLAKSQLSACATLSHLTKHCGNALSLCWNEELLQNILFLSCVFDSPLHTRCIEMLCNFSRFPSNNARLAGMPRVVEALLLCGGSRIDEDRTWSLRTLQNLCSDASSKVGLATRDVLSLLAAAAMRGGREERRAAVGALLNLATEPGALVAIMNARTVAATLVHLAHSPETPGEVRMVACDALATIGLWLQTLASTGTMPEEIPFSPLPTHEATGWLRWEDNESEQK